MVEICHNTKKTKILFANYVFNRNFDIFKNDKCSSGGSRVTSLDWSGSDTFTTRDQQKRYTSGSTIRPTSSNSSSKIISNHATGNPFFQSVHDPKFSISRFDGRTF
eukprot:Pompholyxophrys_sp_v1_NODE_572_length_453_cov_3.974874.p2 type:complete len:106 gc:universal NODE_572_length_453_cov_3.974874:326-9(-)